MLGSRWALARLASWVESRWGLGGVSVDVHRVHRVRALISRVMLIVEYEW